jgi:hypothetical protein
MSELLYIEHLTDGDLAFLADVAGERYQSSLRGDSDRIEALLQRPEVYAALFRATDRPPLLRVSPFLAFSVLVNRASQELSGRQYMYEWAGSGERVPVFDVAALRDFAGDPLHRFFLAELLASFTKVASGSFWVETSRGWRRRRFSELDPVSLIELLDLLPENERAGLYRRLGDLTLFLTGVFPDHTAAQQMPPVQRERLRRFRSSPSLAWRGSGRGPSTQDETAGGLELLEMVGRRAYHLAWAQTGSAGTGLAQVLSEMAESFAPARRLLNFLTDRFIFPHRDQWFGAG